ncbi:MAG: UDP-3-O-(3-hydroxymyristoyl)glucosamine N-acyltransferase [Bacteroidota bacterium]|nr:UDP-3-O-(3-hydroxymyristoyl)glucosamine N-acyltransferase [Bacteroidota bacterium]
MTTRELAAHLGGFLTGPGDRIVRSVAPIETAGPGEVTFLANRKYERFLETTRAGAIILDMRTHFEREDIAVIRVDDPYLGFARALRLFHPDTRPEGRTVHPSAVVHPTAVLGENIMIGATSVIAEGASVGDGTTIGAGVVIGDGVVIGKDCRIHPNVTILAGTRIGDRVVIHAGTTIGSDGFGFAPVEGRYEKIPQVGSVIIEDDVEIGANCAIDRGALSDTVIRRGAKLDNLIQIAHNVVIGEHTIIAAQSGVSGSTIVGNHVVIAGQVGIVGHIEIGDGVTVGAQSGVSKSLHGAGKIFRGSPANELHEELRQEAAMRRLPGLIRSVEELETRLRMLEETLTTLINERK